MTRFTSCWLLAGGLVLLAGPAFAEDQDDAEAASLRASIEHERAAVEARFKAREAECASRFAMTACIDRAKSDRRQGLAPLDKSLSALDEAQRRRRAAERLQRIEQKTQAAAVDAPKPPKVPREPPPRATPLEELAPRAGPASGAPSRPEPPKPGAAAAYERRQREAAEHREAVERRNEERAHRRAPAAPLPAPSARGRLTARQCQPSGSTRISARLRLSPPPRARWRALPTSISLASRGGSAWTMAPSSLGVR